MIHIDHFVDERQKSWCVHCGLYINAHASSRDHVPSKCLLRRPYPDNLPVVPICANCNRSFSNDEEYVSVLLRCIAANSVSPDAQDETNIAHAIRWGYRLRPRLERAFRSIETLGGAKKAYWTPEHAPFRAVVVKNARGHIYFEYGEPVISDPASVWFSPLAALSTDERAAFEQIAEAPLHAEVGSRMLMRQLSGVDVSDGWIEVQEDVYRYAVDLTAAFVVRMVMFEYLMAEVRWDMR